MGYYIIQVPQLQVCRSNKFIFSIFCSGICSLKSHSLHVMGKFTLCYSDLWMATKVSFYLDRGSAPARVGLGVTTVLTMVTLMGAVNRWLSVFLRNNSCCLGLCQRFPTWRRWTFTLPFAFSWSLERSLSEFFSLLIAMFAKQLSVIIWNFAKIRHRQLHSKKDQPAQKTFHWVQKEGEDSSLRSFGTFLITRLRTFAQILPNKGRGTTIWWGLRTNISGTDTPTSVRWRWNNGRRCPVFQPSWPKTLRLFHLEEEQHCLQEGPQPSPAVRECQHHPWPFLSMLENLPQLCLEFGQGKVPQKCKIEYHRLMSTYNGCGQNRAIVLISFGFEMRHFYFVVSYKTYWVDSSTFPSVAATSSGIRESHSPWLSSPSTSCTGQFWSASQKFKLKTWCPSRLSNINCESIDQIEDFLNIYTRCPILRGPDENWWWPCARTHHILNWTISSQFHSVMLQGLLLGDIFNHKSILCQHFGVLTPPKLWFKDKQWVNCSIWKANSA